MNSPAPADFAHALDLLNAGALVALPTETVYGLGADASNPDAVAKIFAAKWRPADHPLIVHLANAEAMQDWARDVPECARQLAAAFWPGPLTLILKKQSWVLDAVTGGQDTVGLRVPAHPVALELLRCFAASRHDSPAGIAAPSANRFGRISPTTAEHVRDEFADATPFILDGGPCAVGIESTIVDCSRHQPVVLRPGHITAAQIAAVLSGEQAESPANDMHAARKAAPRVSGSLAAHYAPATPLSIVKSQDIPEVLAVWQHAGKRCGVVAYSVDPRDASFHELVRMPATSMGYAQGLYAALRKLDAKGLDQIIVEALPDSQDWAAIADRLQRATAAHALADSSGR